MSGVREELTVRSEGAICRLVLSRPERGNSLSFGLVEAMHKALDDADSNGARLLVIEGEGRNFCTGFDLSDLDHTTDADLLTRFVRIELLLARLWSASCATLAIARGNTLGAGADLFAACARRIALPGGKFGFPGAGFGLVLGTRRLAERIGRDWAQELITSGATIDAEIAFRLGLATEIAEEADLEHIVSSASASAVRLDAPTFAAIRGALTADESGLDADLAALVRSAARPGLRARIADYRERSVAARSAARRISEQA
jgi:enoyl-CoA hydratase/carnithine racemase